MGALPASRVEKLLLRCLNHHFLARRFKPAGRESFLTQGAVTHISYSQIFF